MFFFLPWNTPFCDCRFDIGSRPAGNDGESAIFLEKVCLRVIFIFIVQAL